MLDLGDRFRLVLNEVELVEPEEALPACRWRGRCGSRSPTSPPPPRRGFAPAAHHSVLCRAIGSEAFDDLAEIAGIELLVIDDTTRIRDVANELRWNQAYYRLAGGL